MSSGWLWLEVGNLEFLACVRSMIWDLGFLANLQIGILEIGIGIGLEQSKVSASRENFRWDTVGLSVSFYCVLKSESLSVRRTK